MHIVVNFFTQLVYGK